MKMLGCVEALEMCLVGRGLLRSYNNQTGGLVSSFARSATLLDAVVSIPKAKMSGRWRMSHKTNPANATRCPFDLVPPWRHVLAAWKVKTLPRRRNDKPTARSRSKKGDVKQNAQARPNTAWYVTVHVSHGYTDAHDALPGVSAQAGLGNPANRNQPGDAAQSDED